MKDLFSIFRKKKTVMVFGYFHSKGDDTTRYKIFESTLVGEGEHYKNAHEFITGIKDMHRKHSQDWAITNVVIE